MQVQQDGIVGQTYCRLLGLNGQYGSDVHGDRTVGWLT